MGEKSGTEDRVISAARGRLSWRKRRFEKRRGRPVSTLPSWQSTPTGSPPPKPSLQRTLTTWTAGCSSSSIASAGWLVKISLNCKSLEAVDYLFPPLSCEVSPDYKEPLRSIDEARETYEELVATFPTSGRYWKAYIEQVGLLPGLVCFKV